MKKYILPGAIVLFAGIIIYQASSLSNIKKELESIKDINATLEQSISTSLGDINSNIQDTLYEGLSKSQLIKKVNFKLNKNQKEGYDLTVSAELSELKESSNVLFMYKDEDSKLWQELEMNKVGELSYSVDFVLPYYKSYEYKIITKGDTIESSDVESLSTYLFMPSSPEISWGENEVGIYLTAYEGSYYSEYDNTKMKSIEVIVSHDKKEKTYKCKYIDEPMYGDDNEVVDTDRHYEVDIPKKDYKGKLDYIRIKVIYENGIIGYMDVTDNKMED